MDASPVVDSPPPVVMDASPVVDSPPPVVMDASTVVDAPPPVVVDASDSELSAGHSLQQYFSYPGHDVFPVNPHGIKVHFDVQVSGAGTVVDAPPVVMDASTVVDASPPVVVMGAFS